MKHIKLFLEYITVNQGANLATNNSPRQFTFDGGDGPSSMDIDPTHRTVRKSKIKRGSDVKEKHKGDKKKRKKYNKENKSLKSIKLTNSDNFGNNGQGNSPGGGGADYTLQGY